MKNSNSHNKVLIIGAICLSILAGVASYKIADIKNQQDTSNPNKKVGAFNLMGDTEDETTNKILATIESSNQEIEAKENDDDPFTITGKDTATSRLAKQVYSDYVNQEAGNSDLTVSDVAQNALSQISSSDMPRSKYGLNDISFTKQSSNESSRLYGNNFAEIYIRNMRVVANNQAKYSENLMALADVYVNVSKELLKINVPTEVSSSHLAIVNNYQILADSFKLINEQTQDPVKSLLGVRSAKTAAEENDQMFINISKYFKNNGIIFDKSEVGSIWNSI